MGTPYLSIPFQTAVDVDFNKGNTLISFIGDIPEDAERFQIRLETADSDNVGLFFEPNLEAGYIIRKALKTGQWSEEEKAGPCPLKAGGPFEILILIEKQEYDIAVNGERFTQFQHRVPPNQIKKIVVDGDVNLVGINLFHESSDDFEGNPNVRSGGHGGGEETIVPKNATKNKAENYGGQDDYYGGGGAAGDKSSSGGGQGGYKPSGGYGTDISGGDSGNYQSSGGYGDKGSGDGGNYQSGGGYGVGGDGGNYQSGGGYGGGNNNSGGGGYQASGGYGDTSGGGGGDGGYGGYGGGQAQQTFPGRKSKFDFAQGSGLIGAAATAIGAYAINKYLNKPHGGGGMGMGGMGGGGGMGGFGGMGGGGGGGNPLANMILGAVGSAAGSQMGYSMTNQIPGMNTLQKHGVPTGMIGSLLGSIMGSKMVRGNH